MNKSTPKKIIIKNHNADKEHSRPSFSAFITDEITWLIPCLVTLGTASFAMLLSDEQRILPWIILLFLFLLVFYSVWIRYRKYKKDNKSTNISKSQATPNLLKVVFLSVVCAVGVLLVAYVFNILTPPEQSEEEKRWEQIRNAEPGETIFWGAYRQSTSSPDKEEIAWLVLDKESDRMLIISDRGLDCQPFHNKEEACTWENSYIRGWLNDDFLKNAFSNQEQEKILTVTVKADKNPDYKFVDVGKDTEDKIFLLSIYEAGVYFDSKEKAQVFPTKYAIFNGAGDDDDIEGKPGWWWLRTPGENNFCAADVMSGGTIKTEGFDATARNFSVRPALWIDIRS